MGSLGDDAGEVKSVKKATNVKTADIGIQNLNSQFSSSQFSGDNIQDGNADKLKMTQSMVHFNDTVLIEEDMFQSQFVDLGAETQVLDDPDCIQNLESQMKQSNIRFGDTILFEAGASHCQVMSYGGGTQIIGDLEGETQIQDDPELGGETQIQDDLELGGETQIQDDPELGGETQVLDDPDIGVETQVLDGSDLRGETHILDYIDLGGETQVLDDPDGINNLGTHLIDDCNLKCDSEGEETDRTEILSDSEGLCDGESVKSDDCLLHEANVQYSSACKQELHVTASTPADHGAPEFLPGCRRRGFTSVRTASLRASGLAARSRAFKDDGTPGRRDTPKIGEKVDKEYYSCGFEKPKEVRNRVGSSTVRKLFSEETLPGNKGFTNNINDAEGDADYPHIPSHDNEFAGLSYVDSQEPGEFSQSTALDFVDRFLKVSFLESDQGVDRGPILKGDSNPASNPASVVKGTQNLAKKASWRPIGGETGIYDWDDSLEDEGGGAFFSRKKEDFFDGGSRRHRSLTKPRKIKGRRLNQLSDKEKRPDILDKTRNLVQSDSRLTLKKKGKMVEAAEMRIKRNLVGDLNEQLNVGVSGEASGVFVTEKDGPDMQNVGFDTQIAAEAMEALHYAEPFPNHVTSVAYEDSHRSNKGSSLHSPSDQSKDPSEKQLPQKRASHSASRIGTGKSKKSKMIGVKLSKKSPVSAKKHFNNASKQFDLELVNVKSKRAKSNDRENFATYGSERQEAGTPKGSHVDEVLKSCSNATSSGCVAVKRQCIQEKSGAFSPISQRTRRAMMLNQSKCSGNGPNNSAEMNSWVGIAVTRNKRKRSKTDVDNSKLLNARNNDSERGAIPSAEVENVKLNHHEQSCMKNAKTDGARLNVLSYPKGSRAHRKFSGQVNGSGNIDALSKFSVRQDANGKYEVGQKRSESDARITSIDVDVKRRTRSSAHARSVELNERIEISPKDRCKQSDVACTTPVTCVTPVNAASPVCMGNEYFKQSCKKNVRSCLMKEINSLIATVPEPASASKVSRKRRDMAHVRALFSQHLDEDIIKHQKKILARLGASIACSISDATHFVTDEFVRTRNMLEAIASGKPVVTHLWLESCNQTGCFIDEKSYLLRDAKKEKEFGFSMPVSLAHACQYPLLQNRRVLITPNTKPGKETIASLVKAVQGQAVERIGRSALKEDKIPDNLLVISCEEDYATCVPFLEKGAAIYSSELLLNGIVTQKLEYERYRLFEDHVKRTRSTIWLRQDGKKFLPVPKRT